MAWFEVLSSKPRAALIAALCAGAVVVYVLFAWSGHAPQTQYATAKVGRLDIEDTVLAAGVLQPIQQVDVGTRATGQLKSLKVRLGDRVRAGDLLGEIDSLLQDNELRAQQANIANLEAKERAASARLRKAKLELERQQGLIHGAATSRRDLESAEAEVQADEADLAALGAQIAQAKSLVKTAEANLSFTKIVAPIDGEVVAILLLAAIGLISLLVGGIGDMNIMLVSVSERAREIGLRLAVGARQADIRRQFLLEAIVLCLIGAALGVLLCFLLILAANPFLPSGWSLELSPQAVLTATLCASLTGTIFGYFPARNAARLDPVEALARE